jgi:hypothetical protein
MLSCLNPHLIELLKKQFGTVHDTTKEILCNLQPYSVFKTKCSLAHYSAWITVYSGNAYEQAAVDGDILRYTESCSPSGLASYNSP